MDQLTTYLTRSGTERQLALLGPKDLLLTPDVTALLFTVSDFEQMPRIMAGGEAAARGMREQLKAFSVNQEEYRPTRRPNWIAAPGSAD